MLRYDFGAKARPFKSYNAEKGYTDLSGKPAHTWQRHIFNVGGEMNSRADLALRTTRGKVYGGTNIGQVEIASAWKSLSAANSVTKGAFRSRHLGVNWKKERNELLKKKGVSLPTHSSAGNHIAVKRTSVEGRGANQNVDVPNMPSYAWPGGSGTYPLFKAHKTAPQGIRYNDGLTKLHPWALSTFVTRPSTNAPGGWLVYTSYPGQ